MSKKVYFKYLTAERALQVISSKQIRFSQPSILNDAFELLPTLDMDKIKAGYFEQTGSDNLKGLENFTLGIASALLSQYSNQGILSLSSSYEIQLMWAHYCKNYTGVIIGFDVDEGLIPSNNENYEFCPVEYSNKRFVFPNPHPSKSMMFHKDICWKYEDEWRIIRPLENLINIKDDIYVSTFNMKAVRCLIYGPLISSENRLAINNALKNDDYSHVGEYVSYLNDCNFEIEIDYLSSIFSDESSLVYSQEELKLRNFRETVLSKGKLFKAMGVIPSDQKFNSFKNSIDLYTNEIIEKN